jgi:hypothetical protein
MGPQGTAALPRGVLSHPVLQGTAAPTGALARGGEMGTQGTSGPWGKVRLEQDRFLGTVEGCVVRLLY